eukprot:m.493911 g.493911  ORF g.493911 m.493911 type:complete len:899 (+) comp57286_c0_seq45:97-2793(+)
MDEWARLVTAPYIGVASVLYNYKAVNDDELTLLRGQTVFIYSKDDLVTGDVGWWLGKIEQRCGLFPLNFVLEDTTTRPDPIAEPALAGEIASSSQSASPQLASRSPTPNSTQQSPSSVAFTADYNSTRGSQVALHQVDAQSQHTSTHASQQSLRAPSPAHHHSQQQQNHRHSRKDSGPQASLIVETVLNEIPFSELRNVKLIGRGGFGLVHLAKYKKMEVAVKHIDSSGMSDSELLQKSQELRAEGELLSGLAHRNVARLFGACTVPPNFSLVMEYARGGSLARALREIKLEPSVIIDWATQIACGMNYLHSEGPVSVVHCDLKSANVLLTEVETNGLAKLRGNVLKITDFGLARKFTQTTHLSLTAGTFQWMAPEVIRNNIFSKRSDVWSFGVVAWELITSHIPYESIHPMSVAYGVALHGCTLPIPDLCPAPFNSIMKHCWQQDPRDRPMFQDVLVMLRAATPQAFGQTPYHIMQESWRTEIAQKFQDLTRTEQEVSDQQLALHKAQQEHQAKQQQLDEQARALELRERDLQLRELALRQLHTQPTPVKRTKARFAFRSSKKINKEGIGLPTDFRHVDHLGADSYSNMPPSLLAAITNPARMTAMSPHYSEHPPARTLSAPPAQQEHLSIFARLLSKSSSSSSKPKARAASMSTPVPVMTMSTPATPARRSESVVSTSSFSGIIRSISFSTLREKYARAKAERVARRAQAARSSSALIDFLLVSFPQFTDCHAGTDDSSTSQSSTHGPASPTNPFVSSPVPVPRRGHSLRRSGVVDFATTNPFLTQAEETDQLISLDLSTLFPLQQPQRPLLPSVTPPRTPPQPSRGNLRSLRASAGSSLEPSPLSPFPPTSFPGWTAFGSDPSWPSVAEAQPGPSTEVLPPVTRSVDTRSHESEA